MKKLAIGCAVVLLVVGAALAGIGYYGYLKMKSAVSELAELGQVSDLEREVRIKTAFVAPSSRELTAAQVDRLVQVQARVREKLGADAAAIERNYKSLLDKKEATVTDLPTMLRAYRDMARALVEAKKAQVQALNDLGLSLGEYRWIRTESYRALGVPFVDMDLTQIAERGRDGGQPGVIEMNGAMGDKGPEANVKLVEKHRTTLEAYLALASFGL
jgi:hypothetical protein